MAYASRLYPRAKPRGFTLQWIKWMQKLDFVRLSFCKNLHAKCYLNESECMVIPPKNN